jgi:hypothetical protein
MSEATQTREPLERVEDAEKSFVERPGFDRRSFLRRTALTGLAAGSASSILAACGSCAWCSSASGGGGSAAVFGSLPK